MNEHVLRKAEVYLEYQPYIDHYPVPAKQLHSTACENDEITINSWRPIWERNVKSNHEKYGPFCDRSMGKFFGYAHQKPVIVAGAGPSIKVNAKDLKERGDITLISCLHNFHYLEDQGVPADFYVSLDAGEVTVEEVSEGGEHDPDYYWEKSKGRKLLCYIGTNPKLLEKWQGEVYFFNAPVPDQPFIEYVESIEKFNLYVSNGGHVLGACLYIAKAFFGASITAYIGADNSFSYDKSFHGWNSKYDKKLGQALRVKDVFGNSVYTWRSYFNFKGFHEFVSMTVPGIYYNCTEGGILGAYAEGNIRSIRQMPLKDFIRQMNMYKLEMEDQALHPKTDVKKLLY